MDRTKEELQETIRQQAIKNGQLTEQLQAAEIECVRLNNRIEELESMLSQSVNRTYLIEALKNEKIGLAIDKSKMFRLIENAPSANITSVKHGRWIPSESDFNDDDILFDVEDWCDWQCTACHEDICYENPRERILLPKYCPNCGARMDEEG